MLHREPEKEAERERENQKKRESEIRPVIQSESQQEIPDFPWLSLTISDSVCRQYPALHFPFLMRLV